MDISFILWVLLGAGITFVIVNNQRTQLYLRRITSGRQIAPVPAAGTPPAAGGAGAAQNAPARKPFWKTTLFVTIIILVVIGALAFVAYQMFVTDKEGGATAWGQIFGLITIVSAFIAGFVLMMLGKKGGGAFIGIATIFFLALLVINWLGENHVDTAGKRLGASLAGGTLGSPSEVSDSCPKKETEVTIHPGEPYTYVRPDGCSTRRVMQWQSTISAPDLWVTVEGSVGAKEHLMVTDEEYSYTYPGAVKEVTMENLGDTPATVWFFYK